MDKSELSRSDKILISKISDLLNESRKFIVVSVNQTIVLFVNLKDNSTHHYMNVLY